MTSPTLFFLGGNGHCAARLEPARRELRRRGMPFTLHELAYPHAATFDGLLDALERELEQDERELASEPGATPLYATGIGGLVALALRARGALRERPLVLQGAVLWGLERRWFPRVMRLGPLPRVLAAALRARPVQRRFAAKHFRSEQEPGFLASFFAGYGDPAAFAAWFDWLTPGLLRRLERDLVAAPAALAKLRFWWGQEDTVVGLEELRLTERALGVRLPVTTFPGWGHYPMIDDPAGWVREVSRVLAAPVPTP